MNRTERLDRVVHTQPVDEIFAGLEKLDFCQRTTAFQIFTHAAQEPG